MYIVNFLHFRFIASAGTYANLVRQAKSKQKIIDKMEAAGLIEKIETGKALRFVTPTFISSYRSNQCTDSTLKMSESYPRLSLPLIRSHSLTQAKKRNIFMTNSLLVSSKSLSLPLPSPILTSISMDSRVAILGANGTGKSTLLHLITGALQPREGTVSKHSALKLAKYSQHSADQLPYDQSPIEYFQSLFSLKYPEKDIMVCLYYLFFLLVLSSYSFC
jgi:ATP-binding cassette subfamily F protein 2